MIIAWNGSARTAVMLCASNHERWAALVGRNVKKSLKMRLWVITPETIATSMNIAQSPANHRPQMTGR